MTTQSRKNIATFEWIAARQVRTMLAAVLLHSTTVSAEVTWPAVGVPQSIETFAMGGEMAVNGLPLRMRGLWSRLPPTEVAALFRASLGNPLAENAQGAKVVLGRAMGEFYATVQLEPAGSGTRGVVAVTRLSAAIKGRVATRQTEQRLITRFPAGSKLVSRITSEDGLRHSDALTLSNSLDVEFNVQHIKQMLDAEGYQFERAAPSASGKGVTLFFKQRGAQAVAVVYREPSGNTAIIVNTVTDRAEAK